MAICCAAPADATSWGSASWTWSKMSRLQGLEDEGPDYLGTVKSNYLGTEFTAYEEWVGGQGAPSPYSASEL